jgi:hypothetical protein
MEKEYTVELIPSDFEGNKHNPCDCIGSRAFKRAAKDLIFWSTHEGCLVTEEGDETYVSYRNEQIVNMMTEVKVGDTITFKKIIIC